MIIGSKEKERVKKLELECSLSRELIESLKNDLVTISKQLGAEKIVCDDGYLWKIPNDIGRCQGHLD